MHTFIRRASVCLPVMLALSAPQLAHAAPPAKTSGVLAISAGGGLAFAASLIGAPVAGVIAAGQGVWGLGCVLFDPPDTANAGVAVAPDAFAGFHLPDVQVTYPSTPAALAVSLNHYADVLDNYLSNVRAYRETLDRVSGAQQLGRDDWAAARGQEAQVFQAKINFYADQAQTMLPSVLSEVNAVDPTLLSTPLSLTALQSVRDQAQLGNLPSFEQDALNAWAVTAEEKMHLTQRLGALTDQDLTQAYNQLKPGGGVPTVGDAFTGGLAACATCVPPVPEADTYLYLLIGMGAVGALLWRRRIGGGAMPPMMFA